MIYDDPKAAHLDEQQNHDLPKQTPGGDGGHGDQARHAGGGGGGKQSVGIGDGSTAFGGDGQSQQETAQQDQSQKAEHDDVCGG